MNMIKCTIFLSILIISAYCNDLQIEELKESTYQDCGTELINEESSLLFLSTLDGSFFGVDHRTGKILWNFKREAAVKVPVNENHSVMPLFLPDPKDGSLYILNTGSQSGLKKLSFTIQQLVSSSPCRSTDGIFYTGKKIDNWFAVDWRTGKIQELLDSENNNKMCRIENRNSIFLGRTEYNLMMHDIKNTERRWNITYYDYAVNIAPTETKNSDFAYFSGSYTGKFIVLERNGEGSLLWETDFGSPVIGVYGRDGDGLVSLPFTTADDDSMHTLHPSEHTQFFSTLYIGAHVHGLYALPAIATINSPILLLDGPPTSVTSLPLPHYIHDDRQSSFLGHYKVPEYGNTRLQITGRSDPVIHVRRSHLNKSATDSRSKLKTVSVQTEFENNGPTVNGLKESNNYFIMRVLEYILMQENMLLKLSMVCVVITMVSMFLYLRAQMHELRHTSNHSSSRSSTPAMAGSVTAVSEELPDGSIRVGKIQFHTNCLLGKGCEGTFVFKGEFDNRAVAVKRLLPECFVVADREVCLLRESDQHPNVIRYFCMEQDKQFRYIALELCEATLQEYAEKGVLNSYISPPETLFQATAGLEYLHALNIVHRDIKPHNVLLSIPCQKSGTIRVMISDFGLCKKLQHGRVSFSRRSGITGTDGWIAPEIINGNGRTTTVVDIFSLGCLFYYVLSKGKHPFGDSLRRQANIMNGDYTLNDMSDDPYELWKHVITKMITKNPTDRPSATVIKNHPAFWERNKLLCFLQDVSDRIEKEEITSDTLIELETGNTAVLTDDWRNKIEPEIAQDLRKHRNYRGNSLRDLLRALRNKKHHYRELPESVRNILGLIPDEFVEYWMSRFPLLFLHTWLAMQCIKNEEIFRRYYSETYTFPRIHSTNLPDWIISELVPLNPKKKPNSNTSCNSRNESSLFNNYFHVNVINKKFSFFNKNTASSCDNLNWRDKNKFDISTLDNNHIQNKGYSNVKHLSMDNVADDKVMISSIDKIDGADVDKVGYERMLNDDDENNIAHEVKNGIYYNMDVEVKNTNLPKYRNNVSSSSNSIRHRNRHRTRRKTNSMMANIKEY